jgi:heme/copper-type cytochrome/quinol oxidase subunit 3
MRMHSGRISIWFFIGVLLTVYGALIAGYGVVEMSTGKTAHVILANLHAPLWWGGLLLTLGLFYLIKFRPGRSE